jgi:hypothetical protein
LCPDRSGWEVRDTGRLDDPLYFSTVYRTINAEIAPNLSRVSVTRDVLSAEPTAANCCQLVAQFAASNVRIQLQLQVITAAFAAGTVWRCRVIPYTGTNYQQFVLWFFSYTPWFVAVCSSLENCIGLKCRCSCRINCQRILNCSCSLLLVTTAGDAAVHSQYQLQFLFGSTALV